MAASREGSKDGESSGLLLIRRAELFLDQTHCAETLLGHTCQSTEPRLDTSSFLEHMALVSAEGEAQVKRCPSYTCFWSILSAVFSQHSSVTAVHLNIGSRYLSVHSHRLFCPRREQGFYLEDDPELLPFLCQCPVVQQTLFTQPPRHVAADARHTKSALTKPLFYVLLECPNSPGLPAQGSHQEQDTWGPSLPESGIRANMQREEALRSHCMSCLRPTCQAWRFPSPPYILNLMDVTFHFKKKSIF